MFQRIMPLVLKELISSEATNRRNAAFCVGELCKNGGEPTLKYPLCAIKCPTNEQAFEIDALQHKLVFRCLHSFLCCSHSLELLLQVNLNRASQSADLPCDSIAQVNLNNCSSLLVGNYSNGGDYHVLRWTMTAPYFSQLCLSDFFLVILWPVFTSQNICAIISFYLLWQLRCNA